MRVWPCLALLAAIGGCSTFTEDTGVVGANDDAGTGPTPEGGPFDGEGPDATLFPADAEAGPDPTGCVAFGTAGVGVPSGWALDGNASNLFTATVDNRSCMEGRLKAAGDRAAATRDLTIPASGQLTVTVDLHLDVESNAFGGWLVNVVTVACTTPQMQVSLEVSPGGALAVETSPAAPPSVVALDAANVPGLAKLRLRFTGNTEVLVDYRTIGGSVVLPLPLANAKGCVLTVGAIASGNIPNVTADIAEVCVTSP